MSIQAWEVCGTHLGMTIKRRVRNYENATWLPERGVYEGVVSEWVDAEILMITHKKNGNVKLRVTGGGELEFTSHTELVLS